jgi:hypothetical protein
MYQFHQPRRASRAAQMVLRDACRPLLELRRGGLGRRAHGNPVACAHSHTNLLLEKQVSVEGKLEELRYANPHVVLKIRTAEGVVYSAEWQGASWLQFHAHVMLTTLRVGDHVIVSGSPSRDPALRELVRLKEVRRPRDEWTYRVIQER